MKHRSFLRIAAALAFAAGFLHAAEVGKPNIIILYADDMGYGDLGANNPASKIPTPHLDRLAAEGMRFTDGHSSSGICTPSRYAMLTGRHHWRDFHGIAGPFDGPVFKPGQLTLPAMLRQQGYATACIGKWHLGMDWEAIRKPGTPKKSIKHTDFDLPRDAAADSHDFLTWLKGETKTPPRSAIVHNTSAKDYAIRFGDWLLVDAKSGAARQPTPAWVKKHNQPPDDDQPVELYNLKDDIGQRNNLAAKHPEKVSELQALMKKLRDQGHSAPRLH